MPWAPNSRARSASAGVSALVRTSMVRYLSDHFITVAKSLESLGVCVAISPTITSPVEPSIDSMSLWVNVLPPTLILRALASIRISPAPATQQRPQPRATTAAWLVMPPVLVRIPAAECMPSMSSGLVSLRTSSTFSPACVRSTASAAVKASFPKAAPGEAGSPMVSSFPCFFAFVFATGLKLGSNS